MDVRNQKGRGKRREYNPIVQLSKTLSYLLRHGAEKEGLSIRTDGFVLVSDLLRHGQISKKGTKYEDIIHIVENNDKKRFELQDIDGLMHIRANQGHTITVNDLDLTPITMDTVDQYPTVVHGTFTSAWKIIKSEGLSRMSRNHIHFAKGLPGTDEVISGMRKTCDIMIYIDLKKAIQDGVKFYVSANGVILSPGLDNGILPLNYVKEVISKDGECVYGRL